MSEWKQAALGDLAEVQLGKMLDRKRNQGEYRRYLGNDNVQWNEFNLDGVKEMRFKENELERFRLKKNDLLVCEGGDPGRCALWEGEEELYYQKALNRVRVGEQLDARFLLYYMMYIGMTKEIRQYYTGGATIKHLPNAALRRVIVRYPSLRSQKKIAELLNAYDKLIENNRKQISLLEEAAQRLYKEWFVDRRFPNGKTSADTAGWTQLSITECANVIRGRSYTSAEIDCDEGVALVNLKNLRSFGGWNDGAEKTYSGAFKEEQRVSSGDIIMGVTDMTKERRLVGHVALVPDLEREAIISMDLIKLVPVQVESLYLYAHLRFSGIAENIALLANGTNVLHLKPQILSNVQVPIPSKGLQSDFARHMAPMVDEINLCSKRIASVQEARDRLLPKLMSGEIEVEG